jgi:hypothetical protein
LGLTKAGADYSVPAFLLLGVPKMPGLSNSRFVILPAKFFSDVPADLHSIVTYLIPKGHMAHAF